MTITVVSPNGGIGALVPNTGYYHSPNIVFEVRDDSGALAPNVPIAFSATGVGTHTGMSPQSGVTDASGHATFIFFPGQLYGFSADLYTITAHAGSASLTFYECQANMPPVRTGLINPQNYYPWNASAPIQVSVFGLNAVPNVAVWVDQQVAGVWSTLSSAEAGLGVVYTNAAGLATITPAFVGAGTFRVNVGGLTSYSPLFFDTSAPSPPPGSPPPPVPVPPAPPPGTPPPGTVPGSPPNLASSSTKAKLPVAPVSKSKLILIPLDVKATDPGFIPLLNDRLRQIADSGAASTTGAASFAVGTHTARLLLKPGKTAAEYFETDRLTRYFVQQAAGGALQWTFEGGFDSGVFLQRPTDLKAGDAGFTYSATDTGHVWIWTGTAWKYQSGTQRLTAAQLAALTLNLTYDGALFYTTDYGHISRYNAALPGMEWAPGTLGDRPGSFHLLSTDPTADPNVPANAWALCTGAAFTIQKPDGSTQSITTPNAAGGIEIRGTTSAYSATVTAAVAVTPGGAASIPPFVSIPWFMRR